MELTIFHVVFMDIPHIHYNFDNNINIKAIFECIEVS